MRREKSPAQSNRSRIKTLRRITRVSSDIENARTSAFLSTERPSSGDGLPESVRREREGGGKSRRRFFYGLLGPRTSRGASGEREAPRSPASSRPRGVISRRDRYDFCSRQRRLPTRPAGLPFRRRVVPIQITRDIRNDSPHDRCRYGQTVSAESPGRIRPTRS